MRKTLSLVVILLACAALSAAQAGQPNPNAGQITVITGPVVQNLSDNGANIVWNTSAPSETIVKYGTDPNNLSQTAQQPYGEQRHSVQLGGLQPGTTYYFRVVKSTGETLKEGQFR